MSAISLQCISRMNNQECKIRPEIVNVNSDEPVFYLFSINSCTLYIVLFSIIFTTNIGISTYFIYYKYMNRNIENVSRYDYAYQTANY